MKYFTLAASLAFSTSALSSYEEYVADDVKPVCAKHFDQNKNRLCNLFLSCHFDKFQSGKTGQMHCPEACANFQASFPREMCKADHWNQLAADKFDIDEDNNRVCLTNPKIGTQCVAVQGFCDIGEPAAPAAPAEPAAPSGPVPMEMNELSVQVPEQLSVTTDGSGTIQIHHTGGSWNNVVFANLPNVNSYSIKIISPEMVNFVMFGWSCDAVPGTKWPGRWRSKYPGVDGSTRGTWKAHGLVGSYSQSRGSYNPSRFYHGRIEPDASDRYNLDSGELERSGWFEAGGLLTLTIDRDAEMFTYTAGQTSWRQKFYWFEMHGCDNYYPSMSFTSVWGGDTTDANIEMTIIE